MASRGYREDGNRLAEKKGHSLSSAFYDAAADEKEKEAIKARKKVEELKRENPAMPLLR